MISKNLKNRIYTTAALFALLYLIFIYEIVLVYSLIILSVLSIIEFLRTNLELVSFKIFDQILIVLLDIFWKLLNEPNVNVFLFKHGNSDIGGKFNGFDIEFQIFGKQIIFSV